MTEPPGPTPPDAAELAAVLKAVQSDPQAVATAALRRLSESRKAGNVCMMGGWTS